MNTHSDFIDLGNGAHVFIDGIPDTCPHKHEDEVFQSKSGKWIYWHTYRQWASYTADMRRQLIFAHHNGIEDPILLGTSECRQCKRIFSPPMF